MERRELHSGIRLSVEFARKTTLDRYWRRGDGSIKTDHNGVEGFGVDCFGSGCGQVVGIGENFGKIFGFYKMREMRNC
jgi:hypothetical protein